jgi:hypothetical protein
MAKSSWPFDAGDGSTINEARWYKMARLFFPSGVIEDDLNELAVSTDGSGLDLQIATGRAFIQGHAFESDAIETVNLAANATGGVRTDRVVVRLDRAANTVDFAVLTGAAGGGVPALTQNVVTWEIPLAQIAVANGAVNIVAGNITDQRARASGASNAAFGPAFLDAVGKLPLTQLTAAAVLTGDARLADTRIPTDGSVTNAKVAVGAGLAESKLALASDAPAGTPSRRTLGGGATQAAPGNHTHANSHVEGKVVPGGNTQDTVTWTTAFATSPVVVVSSVGSSAPALHASSVSTTGATINSNTNSSIAHKHVIAREAT